MKAKSSYAERRKVRGADSYGDWRQGVQQRADVIAGRVLVYNDRTGAWRSAA